MRIDSPFFGLRVVASTFEATPAPKPTIGASDGRCRPREARGLLRVAVGLLSPSPVVRHLETSMTKYRRLRETLEARLGVIVRRVGKIEGDLRQGHDRDWTERAIELENDEVLEGLDELSRAEAVQLREALRRIETGRYGFCTECGAAVSEERLEALPFTSTCIWCAQK